MFVMNSGRVYVEKVYEIPEGSRIAKGRSLTNVLELQKDEKLAAMLCFKSFTQDVCIVLCTRQGIVKKTTLAEYKNYRRGGLMGITVDEGDRVISAKLTRTNDELVLVTYLGMSIRFPESDLRDQGRVTRGVKGIALKENDFVQAMEVVDPQAALLVACENGMGKRTDYTEYRVQSRAGTGVIATKTNANVAGALSVHEEDEIMLFTQSGQAVRSPVKGIRIIGRATQGVKLIQLAAGDKLVGICRVIQTDEQESEGESMEA